MGQWVKPMDGDSGVSQQSKGDQEGDADSYGAGDAPL